MRQSFQEELSALHTDIARLGGLVEEAIGKALAGLGERNSRLLLEVRDGDDRIDALEVAIEERCRSILALYHPVARDLRFLVTVLKVNNELEHMGDLAEDIARKATRIPPSKLESSPMELIPMGACTQRMVAMALDALLSEDSSKAYEIIHLDEEVDQYHAGNHRLIAERIEGKSTDFTLVELNMLSISRSLERIADIAISIAEDIIYLVDAVIVRHRREK